MATRLKPSRINVDNTPRVGDGAAYQNDDDFHWSVGGGDMSYEDFEWHTLTGNSITIEDISNNITPSSNFTVSAGTELKPGIEYVLRVNTGSTPYTMTLGTGVTNPNSYKTELKPNTVNQFKFIATSTNQLELEGVDSAVVSEINWGEIDGTLSNQTDLQNALDQKLDKVTSTATNPRAYVVNADGSQATLPITDSATSGAIVRRNGTQITVPDTPSANTDAASKKYVDDQVSAATSGAVSDTAYGSSWNGVTGIAPSKNAVYDKISAMDTTISGKANDSDVVKLTGDQTIAGTKTFSTSPVVPSKTTDATNTGTAIATEAQVYKKQDTLVSGTNIKTINSNSLLGSGDIALNDVKASATAPSSPTEGMVWYDTTNDVLKSYDGTNWNIVGDNTADINTKTFYISSTSDTTNAQAAYDWYAAGKEPLIVYNNVTYICQGNTSIGPAGIRFISPHNTSSGHVTISQATITFTVSSSTVTTITTGSYLIHVGEFLPETGGIKLFTYPSVNTNIIEIVSWLDGGGNVGFGDNGHYWYVSDWDSTNKKITAEYDSQVGGTIYVKEWTYDSSYVVTSIANSNYKHFNPSNAGSTDQVLTKTAGGYEWAAPQGTTYNAGRGIEIKNGPDYSAMRGPCPDGFHVPLSSEFEGLKNAMDGLSLTTGSSRKLYLYMPFSGRRNNNDGSSSEQGNNGIYWSASPDTGTSTNAYRLALFSSFIYTDVSIDRSYGYAIRPFKDKPVTPDSGWTTLHSGTGSAGIFYNSTLGLISISSDGITWITIADKNLGATTVYNDGDTLSENNCGKYYQWGNNYGFPFTGSITTSSTQVDASTYGPGNYYSSSTFIISGGSWDTTYNGNLWGGETGVVTINNAITNTGVLSVNGQTGDVVLSAGDVLVSDQANNILTSGMKIWAGTQANYDNLGTYDNNTVYLTI